MPLRYSKENGSSLKVGVWHITEGIEQLQERLNAPDSELTAFKEFRSVERKLQWLSTRCMLHELLHESCKVRYHDSGKPFLLDRTENLSISHSHVFAAVCFGNQSHIGIDIQRVSGKVARVQHKFIHEDESAKVESAINRNLILTLIWSAKEAIYKDVGNSMLYFKEHICVAEINSENHRMIAMVDMPGMKRQYNLVYETFNDYVLVYLTE